MLAVLVVGVVIRTHFGPSDPQLIRVARSGPAQDTPAARGQVLYERYGCVPCHGAEGNGGRENPNAETDGKVPGVVKVAEGYTKVELVSLLRHGTSRIGRADASGPLPPYRMPGWGDRLSDAQLQDLVEYLISLAPKSATPSWR